MKLRAWQTAILIISWANFIFWGAAMTFGYEWAVEPMMISLTISLALAVGFVIQIELEEQRKWREYVKGLRDEK